VKVKDILRFSGKIPKEERKKWCSAERGEYFFKYDFEKVNIWAKWHFLYLGGSFPLLFPP
jgi:hypothetical protein